MSTSGSQRSFAISAGDKRGKLNPYAEKNPGVMPSPYFLERLSATACGSFALGFKDKEMRCPVEVTL